MALQISDPRTLTLIAQLASRLGVDREEAVRMAVQERLDRDARLAGALALAHDCAVRIPESLKGTQHGDLLYDDSGML